MTRPIYYLSLLTAALTVFMSDALPIRPASVGAAEDPSVKEAPPERASQQSLQQRVDRLELELKRLKDQLHRSGRNLPATEPRRGLNRVSVAEVNGTPIICQIDSGNGTPLLIRSMAAVGQRVSKGDVLVEFSATSLEHAVSEHRIKLREAEAQLIQSHVERDRLIAIAKGERAEAEAAVRTAKIAFESFVRGERVLKRKEFEAGIKQAEFEATQLRRDVSAGKVDKSAIESSLAKLEVARLRLDVFEKFTVPQSTHQLERDLSLASTRLATIELETEAQVKQAKANLDAQNQRLVAERHRHERTMEQLKHCQVRAPHDGVVVAHPASRSIQKGSRVRTGQIILLRPLAAKDSSADDPE